MKRFISVLFFVLIFCSSYSYAQVNRAQETNLKNSMMVFSPLPGQVFDEGVLPLFEWKARKTAPKNTKYSLTIKEITGKQKATEALKKNKIFFRKENIASTSFQYPAKGPAFKAGHQYAWEISEMNKGGGTSLTGYIDVLPFPGHIQLECLGTCIDSAGKQKGCMSSSPALIYLDETKRAFPINDGTYYLEGSPQMIQNIKDGNWCNYSICGNNGIADFGKLGCVNPICGMIAWYAMENPYTGANILNYDGAKLWPNNEEDINFDCGKVYYGLSFNGSGYLENDSGFEEDNLLDFGANQSFTISFWMKLSNDDNNGNKTIIDKRKTINGKLKGYYLVYNRISSNGNGQFIFQLADGSANNDYKNYQFPSFNLGFEWRHITIVVKRSISMPYIDLYIDGNIKWHKTEEIKTGDIKNNSPLIVGARKINNSPAESNASAFYKGMLDELQFYNRALYPDEVKAIYDAGAFGLCKPPRPYLPLK
jgi:hypothetical protein